MQPFSKILGEYKSEYDMKTAEETDRPLAPVKRVTHKGLFFGWGHEEGSGWATLACCPGGCLGRSRGASGGHCLV